MCPVMTGVVAKQNTHSLTHSLTHPAMDFFSAVLISNFIIESLR